MTATQKEIETAISELAEPSAIQIVDNELDRYEWLTKLPNCAICGKRPYNYVTLTSEDGKTVVVFCAAHMIDNPAGVTAIADQFKVQE